MAYYALSCLDDAIEATREFLLPFDRGQWLRLAVVVFFLSGGSGLGSLPSAGSNASPTVTTEVPTEVPTIPEGVLPILLGVGVAAGLVVLAYTLVGAVMEFVLVDTLRTESVTVRRSFREQFRRGLSVFLFQVTLGVVTLAAVGGLVYLLVLPVVSGSGGVGLAVSVLAFAFLVVVIAVLAALANLLTVDFVVPTMLQEERGLVSAWRRFWGVLRGDPVQFLVYLAVRIGVAVGVGIAGGAVTGVVGAILAIPFVVVGGFVLFVVGFALSPATLAVFAVFGALYLLLLFAAVALVYVPLKTFVRYYQLLVLGDVETELDLIPDRRASIRSSPLD